jgi:hypothetical protein
MTNEGFTNTSIKTGIVLQLMTTNNKKKTKGNNNRIQGNIIILISVSYTRMSFQIIFYNEHIASVCVKSSSCRKILGWLTLLYF